MVFRFTPRQAHFVRPGIEELEARCLLDANLAALPLPQMTPGAQMREVGLLQQPRGSPAVVFLGDSITERFQDGAGAPVWNSQIAPLNATDYGVGGNTTTNVLWQIDNGQLAGISPRVIVLMVGVNNLVQGQTPEQTANGIWATVQAIQAAQPQAHILLLGILPVWGPSDPMRPEVDQTNALIAGLGSRPNVTYLDAGANFLLPGGWLDPGLTLDGVHPSQAGYTTLANAILPTLNRLLTPPPAPTPAPPPNGAGPSAETQAALAIAAGSTAGPSFGTAFVPPGTGVAAGASLHPQNPDGTWGPF